MREPTNYEELPPELQHVFRRYRDAFPELDASPEFMPRLWSRIESRKAAARIFRRFSMALVTAAGAVCIVLSVASSSSDRTLSPSTYVEILDDHASSEDASITAL